MTQCHSIDEWIKKMHIFIIENYSFTKEMKFAFKLNMKESQKYAKRSKPDMTERYIMTPLTRNIQNKQSHKNRE